MLPSAKVGKNSSHKMRSSEFRCPEHISAPKALELKANVRVLPCFMPVLWKVTNRGLKVGSIYGVHEKTKYHTMWCPRISSCLIPGTVTKVLETVRRWWDKREGVGRRAIRGESRHTNAPNAAATSPNAIINRLTFSRALSTQALRARKLTNGVPRTIQLPQSARDLSNSLLQLRNKCCNLFCSHRRKPVCVISIVYNRWRFWFCASCWAPS